MIIIMKIVTAQLSKIHHDLSSCEHRVDKLIILNVRGKSLHFMQIGNVLFKKKRSMKISFSIYNILKYHEK